MSNLKEAMYDLICQVGSTSFVELSRIKGFEGEYAMQINTPLGVAVLWTGMSMEASEGLNELLKEKRIEGVPTNTLVYMIDGGMLELPLTNGRKSKKERWLPIVFNKADKSVAKSKAKK